MRNPFRIRASQRSVNDEEFVKLFGSGALELVQHMENPWGGLVFLRSAPGGGKTTFLRLLTPRPLQLTHSLIDDPNVRSTHDGLASAGAIGDNGPEILGTMVVFTTEYRELAEYDRGNSLFRELLNSRIVIAVLRVLLERSQRVFPDDLGTIRIEWAPESAATIPASASGEELFRWASQIENGFYERMDDLGEQPAPAGGHARLDGLEWFARCSIIDINGPVELKRVLLLDELQTLSAGQRASLTELITNARENCGIWVAERLEALNHRDLLSQGALEDRDYEGVIQLERQWAGSRSKTYAKFVEQIANLRAAKAEGFDGEFYSQIDDRDDTATWGAIYDKACEQIRTRIKDAAGESERYRQWIADAQDHPGSALTRALRWRLTEIIVHRDLNRRQSTFSFDVLTDEEFEKRAQGAERAAEHFLRTELKAPVYFGRETLASVSSSNVDQYLEVAGELFAEIAAKIRGARDRPNPLTSDRQDAIIRRVAKQRWDGLIRRLPQGRAAKQLLTGFAAFSKHQTFRPTAPYVPGVTGFAITMTDRKTLIDSPDEDIRHLIKLRDVLTSLVAHNLLIPSIDRQHGGKSIVLFYLNRLLCVQFNLPLGLGGWRLKSLSELNEWIERGAAAEANAEANDLV